MQEEIKSYPPSIASALHAVMSKCGYVQKKGTNSFQNYKYAGEGHVLESLRPEMVEAGLLLIPSGKSRSPIDEYGITHVEVEYTLLHKDGSVWPDKIVAYGDGGDKNSKGVGDKGLYKALTGANKYLLFKLFQLETGDDPEKDDAPPADTAEHMDRVVAKQDNAPAKPPAPWHGPLKTTALKTALREFSRNLKSCTDGDELSSLVGSEYELLRQCYLDLPAWWSSGDGAAREAIIGMATELKEDLTKWVASVEKPAQQAAE